MLELRVGLLSASIFEEPDLVTPPKEAKTLNLEPDGSLWGVGFGPGARVVAYGREVEDTGAPEGCEGGN